ncbi:hypothetical protein D9M69_553260 [compost metagenome]
MLEDIIDCLDVRMSVGEVFRHPPALHRAIGQHGRCDHQLSVLNAGADDIGQKIDPSFRRDVWLALLGHRRDRRDRIALYDFGVATVTFVQDEFVQAGEHFGALPVHAGDRDVTAIRSLRSIAEGQHGCCKACRGKKFFHGTSSLWAMLKFKPVDATAYLSGPPAAPVSSSEPEAAVSC